MFRLAYQGKLGEPVVVLEKFWNRKLRRVIETGGYRIFPSTLLSYHSTKTFVDESFCVSEMFPWRKMFEMELGC